MRRSILELLALSVIAFIWWFAKAPDFREEMIATAIDARDTLIQKAFSLKDEHLGSGPRQEEPGLPQSPCDEELIPLDFSVGMNALYARAAACLVSGESAVTGYTARGYANYHLGRFREAESDFESALALDKDNLYGQYFLGLSYLQSRRIEKSLGPLTRAIEIEPEFVDAYYRRSRANDLLGRKLEALKDLDEVIKLKPTYVNAFLARGMIYRDLKLMDQALENFRLAKDLDITNFRPRLEIGKTLLANGDRKAAWSDLKAAVRLGGRGSEARTVLARLQIEDGEYQEAIDTLRPIVVGVPSERDVHLLRSKAFRKMGQLDEALKSANAGVSLSNGLVFHILERAKIHEARGDTMAAIADYTDVIDHTHSFPEAFEGRIRMYETVGEMEKAKADRKSLKRIDHEPWEFRIHNAFVAYRRGNFDQAIRIAEDVAYSVPRDHHMRTSLADILSGVGKSKKAYDMHLSAIDIGGTEWIKWYQDTLRQKGFDPGDGYSVLTDQTKGALKDCIKKQCMLSY